MKVNLGTIEVSDAEATALRQRLTGSTGKATASRDMVREWALGLLRRHLGGEAPAEPPAPVVTRRAEAEPFQPSGAAVLQRAVRAVWEAVRPGLEAPAVQVVAVRSLLRPVLGWCGIVEPEDPDPPTLVTPPCANECPVHEEGTETDAPCDEPFRLEGGAP